jgi:hypothetical protein
MNLLCFTHELTFFYLSVLGGRNEDCFCWSLSFTKELPAWSASRSSIRSACGRVAPSHSFAQGGDDCWGPAQLSASAPDAESRDSITLLSDEETVILLAEAEKHRKHPAAGIETIYSARHSDDATKVLIFAFDKKNCLIDRGAIPIDEWEKVFGPAI